MAPLYSTIQLVWMFEQGICIPQRALKLFYKGACSIGPDQLPYVERELNENKIECYMRKICIPVIKECIPQLNITVINLII